MKEMLNGLINLCMLCAFMEQLHIGGKYISTLRFVFGLYLAALLVETLGKLL